MQTLRCDALALPLRLPPCAAEPTSGQLIRSRQAPVEVGISINAETRIVTVTAPAEGLVRGVWTLQIETPCGCFHVPLWVEMCSAPAFVGVHLDPNEIRGPIQVCCPNEPDLCAGEPEGPPECPECPECPPEPSGDGIQLELLSGTFAYSSGAPGVAGAVLTHSGGTVTTLGVGGTQTVAVSAGPATLSIPAGTVNVMLGGDALKKVLSFGVLPPSVAYVTFSIFGNFSTSLTQVPTVLPSQVSNLALAFLACTSFNQDISGWDVANVTAMSQMFFGASSFNQDLSGWCVSQIGSAPSGFDDGATAWVLPRPNWGMSC